MVFQKKFHNWFCFEKRAGLFPLFLYLCFMDSLLDFENEIALKGWHDITAATLNKWHYTFTQEDIKFGCGKCVFEAKQLLRREGNARLLNMYQLFVSKTQDKIATAINEDQIIKLTELLDKLNEKVLFYKNK